MSNTGIDQLHIYFQTNPIGPLSEEEDETSQAELFNVLNEIIVATEKVLVSKKDTNIELSLKILLWRKEALNFLNEGRFYTSTSNLWSERELENLFAMFTNLSLPSDSKESLSKVPEYARLLDLYTVYESYEERFKKLIGNVDLDSPFTSIAVLRNAAGSHHTRGRTRSRRGGDTTKLKSNISKVKEQDLHKLRKLFDIQLAPLKHRSRFYVELILLNEALEPSKVRYRQLLMQVEKARESYAKQKAKFDKNQPLYDWNRQYLHLDTFLAREIELALEQFDLERVLFDTSELEKVSKTFKWYQRHRKLLKSYLNEVGNLDISNVASKQYGYTKNLLSDALKSAPFYLHERLKKEKLYLTTVNDSGSTRRLTRVESKNNSIKLTDGKHLPLKVGDVEILSLGKVSLDPGYSNANYIFPVGFRSVRKFRDSDVSTQLSDYVCSIKIGVDGPVFEIMRSDNHDLIWQGISPSEALSKLNAAFNSVNESNMNTSGFYGELMFGIDSKSNDKIVQRKIEALDNSELCTKYIFLDERDIDVVEVVEPDVESRPFVYCDEELVLLSSLKASVERESSSKQRLYSLLKVDDDTLPDLSDSNFSSEVNKFLADAEGVISNQEFKVAKRLASLSAHQRKFEKCFALFSNENNSEKQKLMGFQEATRHLASLVILGLRGGGVEVLAETDLLLEVEVDQLANLFFSLKECMLMLVNAYRDFLNLPLQVQSWTNKWKEQIRGHFLNLWVNGQERLCLCEEYFRSKDEHKLFIDSKGGSKGASHCLEGFLLLPGGFGLEQVEKGSVIFYWPSEQTITNKPNYRLNINGFKKNYPQHVYEDSHGQFLSQDLLDRQVVVYLDDGFVQATIHTYFPEQGLYELFYQEGSQDLYEKVKLFKDGVLETWQNPDEYGKISPWRFKKKNERIKPIDNEIYRFGMVDEYEVFSDDEFVNFQDNVEADPDFLPTKKSKWEQELENLRDHNIPGPRLEAPNLEIEQSRNYGKSINYDACELYVYARTLFGNLNRWSQQKTWFLKWRQDHYRELESAKRVDSKPSYTVDRQKCRSFILQRFKGFLSHHKSVGVRAEDLNGMVLKFEQLLFNSACDSDNYESEEKAYEHNHQHYRSKVRSVLSALSSNVKLQKQVLSHELSLESLVNMQKEDLASEKVKQRRKTHERMMDQDRFLVKPSQAHISKPTPQIPEVVKDIKPNVVPFERIKKRQEQIALIRKVEEMEKKEEVKVQESLPLPIPTLQSSSPKKVSKSLDVRVITSGEVKYQEANKTSIEYEEIARKLQVSTTWKGTLSFPSSDMDSSIVSAECTLRLIDLPSSFINTDITMQIQRHLFSIFPEVVNDENLFSDITATKRIMETDLDHFKHFMDVTLPEAKEQVVVVAKLTCPVLMQHYERNWRRDLTVGALNCVQGFGFEMWVVPPYFNENQKLPKIVRDLPYAVRRSPLALFHLRREPDLNPIHYVISKIPKPVEGMQFDLEDFTFSHDLQGLLERCYNFETQTVCKRTYQERRKQDFKVITMPPLFPYLNSLDNSLLTTSSEEVMPDAALNDAPTTKPLSTTQNYQKRKNVGNGKNKRNRKRKKRKKS